MRGRDLYRRHLWIGTIATLVVGLSGCWGNDRPKTIPISGHVAIDGKPPGEAGKIFFTPTEAAPGYSKRPASGSFNAAGNYRVMSWAPDDGLVPGHYTVSIGVVDPDKTAIPRRYQDSATSGLEVDVPMDQGKIEYNIEVLSK
jgi:hypothetical protein